MQNCLEPRILFVADYQDCCNLVGNLMYVEKCRCNFTIASSPSEALRLIAEEPFDLYILESKLPEMTGIELCRRIRKMDKDNPILFFTGKVKPGDRAASLATGANEFLVKPRDFNRVTERVKNLLNKDSMLALT
jgi:two-component system, OmpR family, manganese sensing response regulator